ncbi:DUF6207 family protein [Streptomyces coeruleorubidus]|uniref:DUF6207 family protein n=1 Tax=Streptomyces coeruleorubidus TaxID=116188 RepID=UPI00368A54E2
MARQPLPSLGWGSRGRGGGRGPGLWWVRSSAERTTHDVGQPGVRLRYLGALLRITGGEI